MSPDSSGELRSLLVAGKYFDYLFFSPRSFNPNLNLHSNSLKTLNFNIIVACSEWPLFHRLRPATTESLILYQKTQVSPKDQPLYKLMLPRPGGGRASVDATGKSCISSSFNQILQFNINPNPVPQLNSYHYPIVKIITKPTNTTKVANFTNTSNIVNLFTINKLLTAKLQLHAYISSIGFNGQFSISSERGFLIKQQEQANFRGGSWSKLNLYVVIGPMLYVSNSELARSICCLGYLYLIVTRRFGYHYLFLLEAHFFLWALNFVVISIVR